MQVVTSKNAITLWQDVIKEAEEQCAIKLQAEIETYLVWLLHRYTSKPDIIQKVFATAFLQALQLQQQERFISLQQVGDECLLYTGLFPHALQRRSLRMTYFVALGRTAYLSISSTTNDLYGILAGQFVPLMDILQSIRPMPDLLPLEAYDQWKELGSERAFAILQSYLKNK